MGRIFLPRLTLDVTEVQGYSAVACGTQPRPDKTPLLMAKGLSQRPVH
jgi:hypothetical protein